MRRSDREIQSKEMIEEILKEGFVCHLGLVDGDQPYVVPLNYAYKDGYIYVHSASSGRKLDLIKMNHKVCFEVEVTTPEIAKNGEEPCEWGTIFRSVIGTGIATILSEKEDKIHGLNAIVEKVDPVGRFTFPDGEIAATTVIRIDIKEMTGKSAND
jgi:nitroimidazol reductase NimA-like FMN-containing flavoprotein (pyridoxamine 5'-phosphate oxidase superfamily)